MAASTAAPSGHAVAVEVDGVRYPSARQAAFALELPISTVQQRINNPNFPAYRWLGATPGKQQVRTPEDCEVAKPLVEPTRWALDGGEEQRNTTEERWRSRPTLYDTLKASGQRIGAHDHPAAGDALEGDRRTLNLFGANKP